MRVLLVKLTSMGDLIHALPALTDAKNAIPTIEFDWVIDEGFQDVAKWHPAINKIIPSAHRRWRKSWLKSISNGEIKKFINNVREHNYDLVIDGQNNLKSAIITAFSRGTRCGLDKHSAREFGAQWFYQKKYQVDKNLHAITRLRQLFSQILNYPLPTQQPDFGIERTRLPQITFTLPDHYLLFIHNASWETKWWPESYWQELLNFAGIQQQTVLLTWGNRLEQERAQRLANLFPHAHVLPFLGVAEMASVIAKATAAVCVDTGLSHLTAALNIPAVVIYGSTDSGLIGSTGDQQIHLQANFPCAPCYRQHCNYPEITSVSPACYTDIPPQRVWEVLTQLLNG
ncbi:MAG: lipopolysaccharide heptosyltransferase I [Legionellales bacterium]|nr:lipopolysaccharide heptosyltransferase I [Legionellales bacterium]